MRLSSKHNNQVVLTLNNFTGGLNTSTTEEQIADNQLVESINFEIQATTGLLRTVSGTKRVFRIPSDSKYKFTSAAYDRLNKHIVLFADNNAIYTTKDFKDVRQIGSLTGDLLPITAVWEDGLIIASGGHLQYAAGFQMKTIKTSPDKCKGCYVRSGRVLVFDDENVRYSAVGDEDSWEEDSNDPAAAVWVEVGYKAGGKIIGMVNMSSDILVIKDNGMLFRLYGEYPEWHISEVAREVYCRTSNSYCNVVNNTFILGKDTMQTIVTTQEYGSMRANDVGANIRNEIIALPDNVKVRYVSALNQIWIITNGTLVIMFDLNVGGFYKREFNANVVDVVTIDNNVYVIKENGIDILDETSFEDENDYLRYEMQAKTQISHYDYLLKRVTLACTGYAISGSDTMLEIGPVKIPLPVKQAFNKRDIVYNNWGYVYRNTHYVKTNPTNQHIVYNNKSIPVYNNWDYVYGNKQYVLDFDAYVVYDERLRYRNKCLTTYVAGKGCKFILNNIKYDIVEV